MGAVWPRMTATLAGEPKTKELRPDRGFSYRLLDEELAQRYRAKQQQKKIGGIFSSLSIFLACLGLFGLASFTVQQRTKESGLRRVLGASTTDIVSLLTWNILRLVLVANVVAWPIAYFTMYRWLHNFAYRVDVGAWTFVASSALVLVVAVTTVGGHAIRAARRNPAEALRCE